MGLSEQQRSDLSERGFIVVPDVLTGECVRLLRTAFAGTRDNETGTQHVEISATLRHFDQWQGLRTHPLVLDCARLVLGEAFDIGMPSGRNPLPGYGAQGLHSDWRPRSAGEPSYVLTTIWMLDEFTEENGATRVVPGTHRRAGGVPRKMAQPDAVHPEECGLLGPAGSVAIFNGHLWHSGTLNQSGRPRRSVLMLAHAAAARPLQPPAKP